MFNNVDDAIYYIESKRIKRSLSDFKESLLKYHYNLDYKVIHVAGTNGKGSTVNYIKELLLECNRHVGTFTSPYIVNHNERIQIDGQPISNDDLLTIINKIKPIIDEEKLSMFEIDILIMLEYFQDKDLDYLIVECGIGGLNDKTNIFDDIVHVITNIGYDHEFMLGNTLEEIALHKVGIVKNSNPLFTTEKDENILRIFKEKCNEHSAKLNIIKYSNQQDYPYHIVYKNNHYQLKSLGKYQVANATLAVNVVGYLEDLTSDNIQIGLDNFSIPGRLEKVGNIYLDGAHNKEGILALVNTLHSLKLKDVGIVFSALQDKDIDEMLEELKDYDYLECSFNDERSKCDKIGYQEAINLMQKKHKNIVVTGSLHFISQVRKDYIQEM